MARTKSTLSAGARLADHLTVGYLAWNCPLPRVHEVLAAHDAHSRRRRGLPHEVLVYFVMAMCLYATVAYEEVLQLVIEGLRQVYGDEAVRGQAVSKAAISQARRQVGVGPLRQLYEEQVRPVGPLEMPQVAYRGLRVMALDGTTLEMPDEADNARRFGYPGVARGAAAFPQLRCVGLVECGTHVICHAQVGPYARSEVALSEAVWSRVDASMLVLADRGFFGLPLWQRALRSGARLLFRVKASQRLPRERELADGSYLSTLYATERDRRAQRNGTVVRVIAYTLAGVAEAEASYRLVTNWLDAEAAPAVELAALYHRRWRIEQAFDELKVHLADRRVTLRSKTPELVEQEFYALLLAHAAVRRLMVQAAAQSQQAAQDLSFVHAIRVVQRRLAAAAAIPP